MDFSRVREAFDRCAALAPDDPQREAILAGLSQPEYGEVRSLLAAHDRAVGVDPVRERIQAAATFALAKLESGQRLGPWRIDRVLGEGGMGMVFGAERDDGEYRQRAAIKVIRGLSSESARARLRQERGILASLDHPHIARLLDGGTTDDGEPYLVMEYVDGQLLPAWQATQGLRARVELFAAVCRAVAYAHQRLVVHRDLKPGNVMVRGDGTPVLLDFGIAKLVEQGAPSSATRTQTFTPAYASPEQLRGEPVTTATDVFGLGALLYGLLGGDLSDRSDPVHAAATPISLPSVAASRSSDPTARQFAAQVRGDLDAIVRVATRLEPEHRYASAALLLQDIEAWLAARPVSARSGERWYVLSKFLVQHRAALAVGVLLLAGGIAFATQLAIERNRAQAASARAEKEAATAREVLDFVANMFGELDPTRGGDEALSARELLDRGRERLSTAVVSSPGARAALQRTMGEIYRNSERPREAIELLDAARSTFQQDPAATRELIVTEVAIAQAYNALLDGKSALPYIQSALRLAEAREAQDPATLAHTLMTHGTAMQRLDNGAAALRDYERAQRLFESLGESGREGLASVLHNRGWVADSMGDERGALGWYRRAIEAKTQLLGADHPSTLNSRLAAAIVLSGLDEFEQAEAELSHLVRDIEHRMGLRSQMYAMAWSLIGSVRQDLGRYASAAEAYRYAIAAAMHGQSIATAPAAQAINNLATLDEDRGDLPAAERGYRESLAARLRSMAPDSLYVARAQHNLGRVLLRAGKTDEAAPLILAARQTRDLHLIGSAPDRLSSHALAIELDLARGDIEAARRAAATLTDGIQDADLPAAARANIERAFAALAVAVGDEAALIKAHESALKALREALPADHPKVALAELILAESLQRSQPEVAASLRARAIPLLDAALAPNSPDRQRWSSTKER
jgi:serine/threonine-protein kinase